MYVWGGGGGRSGGKPGFWAVKLAETRGQIRQRVRTYEKLS